MQWTIYRVDDMTPDGGNENEVSRVGTVSGPQLTDHYAAMKQARLSRLVKNGDRAYAECDDIND